jgi:hypothetical protein
VQSQSDPTTVVRFPVNLNLPSKLLLFFKHYIFKQWKQLEIEAHVAVDLVAVDAVAVVAVSPVAQTKMTGFP